MAITDVGEKMTGAFKDRNKAVVLSDLEGINSSEMADLAVKDRVWPEPDYLEKVRSGDWSVTTAAYVKFIRDRIGRKPMYLSSHSGFEEAAHDYVRTLSIVARLADEARSPQDVVDINNKVVRELRGSREFSGEPDYERNARAVFSIIARASSNGRLGSNPLHVTRSDTVDVDRIIASGVVDPNVEDFMRGYRIATGTYRGQQTTIVYKGNKRIDEISFKHETKEDAKEALREYVEQQKSAPKKKRGIMEIPRHLSTITRSGAPHRSADITADDMLNKFNLRAIEFGEWLPDKERQHVLNTSYDALCDLADVIGIEAGEIGLDKTIALAFGSRGRAGAAAHFEVKRSSDDNRDFGLLHMTRMSGAGSLAHEYGHALDWWMYARERGTQVRLGADRKNHVVMATNGFQEMQHPELFQAIVDSMWYAHEDTESWNEKVRGVYKFNASRVRGLVSEEELAKADQDPSHRIAVSRALVNSLSKKTNLLRESLSSSRPNYFASARELFARCFESYVYDTLESNGCKNDYLVHSVQEDFAESVGMPFNPYPAGEERQKINEVMRNLMTCVALQMQNLAENIDYAAIEGRPRPEGTSFANVEVSAPAPTSAPTTTPQDNPPTPARPEGPPPRPVRPPQSGLLF